MRVTFLHLILLATIFFGLGNIAGILRERRRVAYENALAMISSQRAGKRDMGAMTPAQWNAYLKERAK